MGHRTIADVHISEVAWSRSEATRQGTALVVALHGRGADERGMVALAAQLPRSVTVAAVRAPIAEGGGYAWFANRGIGRPIAESIAGTASAVFPWLDGVTPEHSCVVLLGFSGGTAMGGGLLLAQPQRFAGAVLLSGTLPWDAGFDTSTGRLAGVPVFWANDEADPVIPRELVARSESWLREESGAALTEQHYVGLGHAIGGEELSDVRAFLTDVVEVPGRR
jgi:phospholipase/carboxylesterase